MPASKRSPLFILVTPFLLGIFGLTLALPARAANLNPNRCVTNSACTIGEFLYDDNYAPIAGAACSIYSRDPAGAPFIADNLTESAGGWYQYQTSTASALGYYRTTICCTVSSELMCIDKSFTVTAADLTATDVATVAGSSSLTAADIWNHPTRSLTSFGTLVADIWGNSSRTLSSFGNLISDLWNNSSRTLTTDVATQSDLDALSITSTNSTNITNTNTTVNNISNQISNITTQLRQQRDTLEEIANAPIIETTIEDTPVVSLETKLKQTETATGQTAQLAAQIFSQANQLQGNWSSTDAPTLTAQLDALLDLIGTRQDSNTTDTLNGTLNYLTSAWDNQLTQDLQANIATLTDTATNLSAKLGFYGKSRVSPDAIATLASTASALRLLVGSESDDQNTPTLYGHLRFLNYLSTQLSASEASLNQLLSDWSKLTQPQRQSLLTKIRAELLPLNQLPQSQVLGASTNPKPEITQKNEALYLLALAQTNRLFLAQSPGQPITNIWLEEGSVIFKAVISNPSRVISQTVPLKFYLPREVGQEDVIKMDSALTAHYDTEKEATYVTGNFELAPGQTRVFSIEVTDLWTIDLSQIESLRAQAEQLLEPLKNTNYFGQGATLKSDIDVALDKILSSQETAQTPDARIRAYREAQIEINGVNQKMESLKTLVSAAGSTGSIFGFVGGVQAVAVWGLIIILASGFVFLSLYMRALNARSPLPLYPGPEIHGTEGSVPSVGQRQVPNLGGRGSPILKSRRPKSRSLRLAQLFFLTMATGSLSSLSIGSVIAFQQRSPKTSLSNAPTTSAVTGSPSEIPSSEPLVSKFRTSNPSVTPSTILGTKDTQSRYAALLASPQSPTEVYATPDPLALRIANLTENQTVYVTGATGDYLEIELLVRDQLTTGYVLQTAIVDNPNLN